MKLATTTGDFSAYAETQQEKMTYIRQAGFRYIDYSFGADYNKGNGVFTESWRKYLDDVMNTADKLGLIFVQAHAPMGSPIRRGDYHTQFVDVNRRCIDACAALGIKNLVVHSGYEQDISKDECLYRNRDFFMELLTYSEPLGINILVENFNKMCVPGMYWIDNAPDLKEMIDLVDHPLFHAVWDTGHANMQEMQQDEALRLLGDHVYALHVQDNMGDNDAHVAPFFGTLNLDSLMHGLIDIGYKGYFTFEATNLFLPAKARRQYEPDKKLLMPPLPLRIKAESLLYEIGKTVLTAYDCFEE